MAMHPSTTPIESADAIAPPPTDTRHAARVGLWALGLGLGGFLLWAAWAPLDEGVPSQGVVAIDTKRKAVQHLSGGIVKQVLVREGDMVREGQPLVQLDEAVASATYQAIRQRYLSLRAMEARLIAEQQGRRTLVFHPDLQQASTDPQIGSHMATQAQLLRSRQASLQAELRSLEENMVGQQALLQANEVMLGHRRDQLRSVEEELRHTRSLVQEGYAPRNRQLELERMAADVHASMAELAGSMTRARAAVAELRQRAQARQAEYYKEVDTELANVVREVQSDAEKYPAARTDLERTEIRSPASGQVVGLSVQTVGAVVQPGQKLMDIVPLGEALLLEARIDPHLIDRVRPGLPTDVRFSAFSHAPQLVVQGELLSVSGDLLTEAQTNVSYYLARVRLTPEGMKALGGRQMQPGMPAEIVIKTGERSMLTYLLHPLTKRMAASMKEE